MHSCMLLRSLVLLLLLRGTIGAVEERVDLLLGSPLSYDVGSVPTKCRSSGSTPCANYPEVCCPVNYECCPDETGQVASCTPPGGVCCASGSSCGADEICCGSGCAPQESLCCAGTGYCEEGRCVEGLYCSGATNHMGTSLYGIVGSWFS